MDISGYETTSEPRPVKIFDPVSKEETDIVILCLSPDHPDYKNRMLSAVRGGLKQEAKNINLAALADRQSNMIANMISGWEGIILKGKPFKYSEKNALKLMVDFPWIAEQVDLFVGNRVNFFKGSKTD